MRDHSTTPERSRHMAGIRRTGTAPELAVQGLLRGLGLRYTTHDRRLPGSPDIVNRRLGIAIFVHGCFWHRHTRCAQCTTPKTNVAFWEDKFARNVARDSRKIRQLRSLSLRVATVWACQLRSPRKVAALERRLKRLFTNG